MNKATKLASAIAAGFTAVAVANPADAEIERRTFEAAPSDRVVVDVDFGTINIEAVDAAAVQVVVERAEKLELDFQDDGDTVTVRGRKTGGWWPWNTGRGPHFHITVPYEHDLDLRTAGGGIAIDRLQGEVRARTSGGTVRIGAIDGSIDAKTSGGGIRVESANGPVLARTSGGSIRVQEAVGPVEAKTSGGSVRIGRAHGAIQARTSGGSIEAGFAAQPGGASELRTSGGSITAYLADGVAVDVEARTSGGRVSTELPVAGMLDKTSMQAAINGGGPSMMLRTSGGSIRVRRLQP